LGDIQVQLIYRQP